MTKREGKAEVIDIKGLLARDEDFMRAAMEALVEAALEAEMVEAIGAEKGERSETRVAYLIVDARYEKHHKLNVILRRREAPSRRTHISSCSICFQHSADFSSEEAAKRAS